MSEVRIFLASIRWRYPEPEHQRSFDAAQRDSHFHAAWAKEGDALVDRARAIVASTFLRQSDCDVLLQVDSDISFPVDGAVQICEQAVDYDVVCGMYVTRGRGPRCKPVPIWDSGQTVSFGNDPTPVPVRWPGGGFLATHRRVFERMSQEMPLCHEAEPWAFWPFYTPFPTTNEQGEVIYLSEDYAFGQRAHDLGFGVWMNPAVRLHHWGIEPHGIEDMIAPEVPQVEVRMTRHGNGSYTREWPQWSKDETAVPVNVAENALMV